jgi:hypothetical protein
MPFDPALPANGSPLVSAEMRGQLNGLKDLIDAIPAGPPGQNGSDGTSVTGAIIDGTNTLNPGDAAQASVSSHLNHRSRRLFRITERLLRDIATLAIMGLSSQPVKGYRMPAASGMPRPL